jgi:hypothetical protein
MSSRPRRAAKPIARLWTAGDEQDEERSSSAEESGSGSAGEAAANRARHRANATARPAYHDRARGNNGSPINRTLRAQHTAIYRCIGCWRAACESKQ